MNINNKICIEKECDKINESIKQQNLSYVSTKNFIQNTPKILLNYDNNNKKLNIHKQSEPESEIYIDKQIKLRENLHKICNTIINILQYYLYKYYNDKNLLDIATVKDIIVTINLLFDLKYVLLLYNIILIKIKNTPNALLDIIKLSFIDIINSYENKANLLEIMHNNKEFYLGDNYIDDNIINDTGTGTLN